jgi:hypothetical protein
MLKWIKNRAKRKQEKAQMVKLLNKKLAPRRMRNGAVSEQRIITIYTLEKIVKILEE